MGKPEDIPQDAWDYSAAVEHVFCGCAPGRARGNGTNHHDSCWKKVEAHARAILAAKAEERSKCIADLMGLVLYSGKPGAVATNPYVDLNKAVAHLRKQGDVNTVSKISEEV